MVKTDFVGDAIASVQLNLSPALNKEELELQFNLYSKYTFGGYQNSSSGSTPPILKIYCFKV